MPVFCDRPVVPAAKLPFLKINAHGLLQVDAAHDCLASIAANGLLQVDAASGYSARISSCRGGMGEAQGIRRGNSHKHPKERKAP